jgi:hypothetical protein
VVDEDPTALTTLAFREEPAGAKLSALTQLGETSGPTLLAPFTPEEELFDLALVDVGDGVTALQLPLSAVDLPLESDCALSLEGMPSLRMLDPELWVGAPWPTIVHNGHHEKNGDWLAYEQIGRRWDRPESWDAYRLPVPTTAWVASGYDLDKPDEKQRRAPNLSAVGHGGVDLADKMGTPIRMVKLDHQIGDAEVLYVGHLFGKSVVTRHTIREAGRQRDYVLIFGHLDDAAEHVWRGRRLHEGELVGYMGNTDSPELVHLHLEARRMRDGVDAWHVPGWSLDAREYSVVSDPRNVLPLRARSRSGKDKRCSAGLGLGPPRAYGRDAWSLAPMRLTLDLEAPSP